MTSVRLRTSVTGAALAAVAGALLVHGAAFGTDFLKTALLGLAAGAALGLVPHRSAPERAGAFVLGVLAALVGYALRAGVLPDIPMGRGIAVVVVIGLVTAVAAATAERLPLWAGLLGAAVMAGAYETVYTATPASFTSESAAAATSVALAAAFGFLVASTVPALVVERTTGAHAGAAQPVAERDEDTQAVSLDKLLTTPAGRGSAPLPAPRSTPTDVPTTTESER